jgi:hypothetical protein
VSKDVVCWDAHTDLSAGEGEGDGGGRGGLAWCLSGAQIVADTGHPTGRGLVSCPLTGISCTCTQTDRSCICK